MTSDEIFEALARGGNFALPYLIRMSHTQYGALYFVNNNEDIAYDGQTYRASAFKYTRPKNVGGSLQAGALDITAIDNNVIDILDTSDELFKVDVIGVLVNGSEVQPLKQFHHQYASVTISNEMKVTLNFKNDDRLDMNFPPDVFDADNNRGNA